MKLFVVVFGCLLVVGVMTWMTLSLEKIQVHRDQVKQVRSWSEQHSGPAQR